ncbi:MAG TPA: LPS assembly lipoprotein LptE [Cellvibrionaceae bacterium]
MLRWLIILGLTASLSACGWQLRGASTGHYPAQIQLASPDRYAPLIASLGQVMRQRHVQSDDSAPLRLEVDPETLNKRTVAVTSIGSAAQYELTLSAPWRLYQRSGQTQSLLREGIAKSGRVFDFQPGNNLGKTEEETTLMAEMRREIANSILAQTQNLTADKISAPINNSTQHTHGQN